MQRSGARVGIGVLMAGQAGAAPAIVLAGGPKRPPLNRSVSETQRSCAGAMRFHEQGLRVPWYGPLAGAAVVESGGQFPVGGFEVSGGRDLRW